LCYEFSQEGSEDGDAAEEDILKTQ
jgi:hypothetical protein